MIKKLTAILLLTVSINIVANEHKNEIFKCLTFAARTCDRSSLARHLADIKKTNPLYMNDPAVRKQIDLLEQATTASILRLPGIFREIHACMSIAHKEELKIAMRNAGIPISSFGDVLRHTLNACFRSRL